MKTNYEVIREHCKKLFYKKTYAKILWLGKSYWEERGLILKVRLLPYYEIFANFERYQERLHQSKVDIQKTPLSNIGIVAQWYYLYDENSEQVNNWNLDKVCCLFALDLWITQNSHLWALSEHSRSLG